MELVRCTRCLLPETHETIVFDDEGVCNICRGQEYKHEAIDWADRKHQLDELVETYRGKHAYDCIVPFSGGKDSTWTLYYLVKEYGLRPLVVSFDHGFMRPKLLENTKRTIRELGVAYHSFTPNWKVVQRLMLQSLLEKGDFCWHCHTGIFAYPMRVAIEQEVPLVIWGEPSAEYTAYYGYDQMEEVDEKRFNRSVNLGITADDMLVRLSGDFDERDLAPFTYPPMRDLRRVGVRSVCLGSYVPWDVKRQSGIIAETLGWEGDEVENVPPGYSYEKIECHVQGVRDYLKYIKRGYTRPTHLASIDIRNGRLDRAEGLAMVEEHEGARPPSLDLFLDYVGLTEDEFMEIARSHAVSPWEPSAVPVRIGRKTSDFDRWQRSTPLPRDEAAAELARWRQRQQSTKGTPST
jgi:N-acetyl sugar amidotransferase